MKANMMINITEGKTRPFYFLNVRCVYSMCRYLPVDFSFLFCCLIVDATTTFSYCLLLVSNRWFCGFLWALPVRTSTRGINMCQGEYYKVRSGPGLWGQQCNKVWKQCVPVGWDSHTKRTGVLVGKIPRSCFVGVAWNCFSPLRGTTSEATHYLMSYIFLAWFLKKDQRATHVALVKLNTLRFSKTTF